MSRWWLASRSADYLLSRSHLVAGLIDVVDLSANLSPAQQSMVKGIGALVEITWKGAPTEADAGKEEAPHGGERGF